MEGTDGTLGLVGRFFKVVLVSSKEIHGDAESRSIGRVHHKMLVCT